jgi:hypothetical protein
MCTPRGDYVQRQARQFLIDVERKFLAESPLHKSGDRMRGIRYAVETNLPESKDTE